MARRILYLEDNSGEYEEVINKIEEFWLQVVRIPNRAN